MKNVHKTLRYWTFIPFILLLACSVEAQAPPAEGWVVWQTRRVDSRSEIFLSKADGSGIKRLTTMGAVRPQWAPDGRWISFTGETNNHTYVVRPDGSGVKKLHACKALFWMHDNSGLVCRNGDDFLLLDPEAGTSKHFFKQSDFAHLKGKAFLLGPGAGGITHDGRYLVGSTDLYRNGHTGTNGSFKAGYSPVILDFQNKDKVYYFGSGCWATTPPSGYFVYHVCADCPTGPDLYRMSLDDLMTRSSYGPEKADSDANWGHEYNPSISNDNNWIAYMASTGCHSGYTCDYEIFIHKLGTAVTTRSRVTSDSGFDGYPDMHVGDIWQQDGKARLLIIPLRMNFLVDKGKLPAAAQAVIRNAGSGTLQALTTKVSYQQGSGWLEVKTGGAGNAQTVTVMVKDGSLANGRYLARIQVLEATAANSPQTIEATLTVVNGPQVDSGTPTPEAGPAFPDAGPANGDSSVDDSGCTYSSATPPRRIAASLACLLMLGLCLVVRRVRHS